MLQWSRRRTSTETVTMAIKQLEIAGFNGAVDERRRRRGPVQPVQRSGGQLQWSRRRTSTETGPVTLARYVVVRLQWSRRRTSTETRTSRRRRRGSKRFNGAVDERRRRLPFFVLVPRLFEELQWSRRRTSTETLVGAWLARQAEPVNEFETSVCSSLVS